MEIRPLKDKSKYLFSNVHSNIEYHVSTNFFGVKVLTVDLSTIPVLWLENLDVYAKKVSSNQYSAFSWFNKIAGGKYQVTHIGTTEGIANGAKMFDSPKYVISFSMPQYTFIETTIEQDEFISDIERIIDELLMMAMKLELRGSPK